MSVRKIPLVGGEYFHVYNRGNSKQDIFIDHDDMNRFIKLLYLCNSDKKFNFRDDIVDKKIDAWDFEVGEPLVSIGTWVLMPNHFHIYLTSPISPTLGVGEKDDMNISIFMNKLCTSYSKYFNKKYSRTGGLFEGNFKATHVNDDKQAKYLFSYIHLNPIKLIDKDWKETGIKDTEKSIGHLNRYKWSSYQDYRGIERKEKKILDVEKFPEYFSTVRDFDNEIFSWLEYKE